MNRLPIDRSKLEILPLAEEDAEAARGFSCGDPDLDDFLRTDAARLQAQNVVRTFVAFYDEQLVGYVALLTDAVELKSNERKKLALHFHDHPMVPALKVARLAVRSDFQRRRVGEAMLAFAVSRAIELSEHVGCRLLTLDAYQESVGFYERLGFVRNKAKAHEDQATTHERSPHTSMRLDLFGPELPGWISGASGPPSSHGAGA